MFLTFTEFNRIRLYLDDLPGFIVCKLSSNSLEETLNLGGDHLY